MHMDRVSENRKHTDGREAFREKEEGPKINSE